jgi:hypothetical protein
VSVEVEAYHLQRPDPSYPHLELALDASDVIKLNTFPPASASRFPPEEKELLGHTDGIAIGKVVALDIGPQACKRNTADNSLVGLASTVTPSIVVVEAAMGSLVQLDKSRWFRLTQRSTSRSNAAPLYRVPHSF